MNPCIVLLHFLETEIHSFLIDTFASHTWNTSTKREEPFIQYSSNQSTFVTKMGQLMKEINIRCVGLFSEANVVSSQRVSAKRIQ